MLLIISRSRSPASFFITDDCSSKTTEYVCELVPESELWPEFSAGGRQYHATLFRSKYDFVPSFIKLSYISRAMILVPPISIPSIFSDKKMVSATASALIDQYL